MRAYHAILFVLALAACFASLSDAEAANWPSVRERAMSMREAGRASEAYSLAARWNGGGAAHRFDASFVAGWIALRNLRRPDVALTHFRQMAALAGGLRPHERDPGKAKAGYWLGRALRDLGKRPEAAQMFRVSASYPTTFYGQLAASEAGIRLTRDLVGPHAASYPSKELYWFDRRVKRELVLAVIKEESNFRQSANSSKAARGMMQVLDDTARLVGRQAGVNVDIRLMRSNADYNIAVGSRYLADQFSAYRGNAMLAAVAYNAGPHRVDDWLARFGDPRGNASDPVDWAESIPFHETRAYVQKVLSSFMVYLALGE